MECREWPCEVFQVHIRPQDATWYMADHAGADREGESENLSHILSETALLHLKHC